MAKRLRTNDLNRRVIIQKKGQKIDDAGFPVPNPKEWEDIVEIWSAREPLRGREFFAAAASQSETTARYKIRYRKGISSDMRIFDIKDDRAYPITAVLDDVFDDRTETHLMAVEVSNG